MIWTCFEKLNPQNTRNYDTPFSCIVRSSLAGIVDTGAGAGAGIPAVYTLTGLPSVVLLGAGIVDTGAGTPAV